MKAVLIKGGASETADALYIGEHETPKCTAAGQVLVKVKAFGLNRMDILQRQGKYPLPPGAPKEVLGVEFSGVVEDGNDTEYKAGDEVFGLTLGGAYAEYVIVQATLLVRKPAELSWVEAASIPEQWLTAFQTLFWIGEFKQGQSVLVHAGASGVGLAAIQLAKSCGASMIISTAGTDEKVAFIKQHGAHVGINYKTQDFAKEVAKETDGRGVDVVLDFVGQAYWLGNMDSLARDGHLVLIGLMSGAVTSDPVNLGPLLYKRLRVEGTTLRSRTIDYQGKLLHDFTEKALHKLFSRAKGGEGLDLVIHKVFPWEQVADAHREMEAAKNIGKIICEIPW